MGCKFFIGCQPSCSGGSEQCLSILISICSILRFAVIKLGKGPEWEMDPLHDSAQWCCNSWFASGDSDLLICFKVSWDAEKVYLFVFWRMFVVGCSVYIYGFVCWYVWHTYGNTSCFLPFSIQDKLLSICALFWRDVDETISWIKEKGQLMASDDFGRDLASVQALLRKHEGLERDLAALEDKVPVRCI